MLNYRQLDPTSVPAVTRTRSIFRLQFSLRGLLLLMTLIGVGLVIYRWPWVVVEHNDWPLEFRSKNHTQTTTYRRAWDGHAVKHGRETFVDERGKLVTEKYFGDDELLVQREFDSSGKLRTEASYPPGFQEIQREFETWNNVEIVTESQYRKLNSRCDRSWRVLTSGQLLQSSRIELGCLQLWNEQPVEPEINRLLSDIPAPLRTGWLQVRPTDHDVVNENLGDNVFRRTVFEGRRVESDGRLVAPGVQQSQLVVYFAPRRPEDSSDSIAEFLLRRGWDNLILRNRERLPYIFRALQGLHDGNYTLVARYGLVCAVPITPESLEAQDTTGIEQIRFALGSVQEQEWLTLVPHIAAEIREPALRVKQLFDGSSILVEASKLEGLPVERNGPRDDEEEIAKLITHMKPQFDPPYLRSRRDTLGLFLWHHGYRVTQRENTLLISPRASAPK